LYRVPYYLRVEQQRRDLLAAERSALSISPAGGLRVGVGYPNSYHVAMSSLAYQWVVELAAACPDVGVERFFAGTLANGRTFDGGSALGDLDLLAWSCSFELDAPNLLATLDAAGIPRRREDRDHRHPLVVMGGAVASINPLPLSPAVDVFVLGSAELLWPALLQAMEEHPVRERLLLELASRDGYLVPAHHLDDRGRPAGRRRRVEKRDVHMQDPTMVPASHVVTPNTEYSGRGLVEMSPRNVAIAGSATTTGAFAVTRWMASSTVSTVSGQSPTGSDSSLPPSATTPISLRSSRPAGAATSTSRSPPFVFRR